MSLSTQNFRGSKMALQRTQQNIQVANLNLNADIDVKGDIICRKITTYIKVNKNTDFLFYLILPSDDPEVVDRKGGLCKKNKTKTIQHSLKNFWIPLAYPQPD